MTDFRAHDWFDTEKEKPLYGIQARRENGKWLHVCEGNRPLLYEKAEERDAKLEELRKRKPVNGSSARPRQAQRTRR